MSYQTFQYQKFFSRISQRILNRCDSPRYKFTRENLLLIEFMFNRFLKNAPFLDAFTALVDMFGNIRKPHNFTPLDFWQLYREILGKPTPLFNWLSEITSLGQLFLFIFNDVVTFLIDFTKALPLELRMAVSPNDGYERPPYFRILSLVEAYVRQEEWCREMEHRKITYKELAPSDALLPRRILLEMLLEFIPRPESTPAS